MTGRARIRALRAAGVADPPELPAFRHGTVQWDKAGRDWTGVVLWCNSCRVYHWHALALGQHRALRRCQCSLDSESPYLTSGYILVDCGPVTPEIKQDLRRRLPHGPHERSARELGSMQRAVGLCASALPQKDVLQLAPGGECHETS